MAKFAQSSPTHRLGAALLSAGWSHTSTSRSSQGKKVPVHTLGDMDRGFPSSGITDRRSPSYYNSRCYNRNFNRIAPNLSFYFIY